MMRSVSAGVRGGLGVVVASSSDTERTLLRAMCVCVCSVSTTTTTMASHIVRITRLSHHIRTQHAAHREISFAARAHTLQTPNARLAFRHAARFWCAHTRAFIASASGGVNVCRPEKKTNLSKSSPHTRVRAIVRFARVACAVCERERFAHGPCCACCAIIISRHLKLLLLRVCVPCRSSRRADDATIVRSVFACVLASARGRLRREYSRALFYTNFFLCVCVYTVYGVYSIRRSHSSGLTGTF